MKIHYLKSMYLFKLITMILLGTYRIMASNPVLSCRLYDEWAYSKADVN